MPTKESLSKNKSWIYHPVTIEIEISHNCPVLCAGCAIRDDIEKARYKLTENEIIKVLREAKSYGIKNYSLTGGEPFLDLPLLKTVIMNAPIDLVKINTNCFLFQTPNKTRHIFKELKDAGFSINNKKTTPWLNLSIGQQNLAGVPLENSVFACLEFHKLFSPEKARIAILVFSLSQRYSEEIINRFMDKYEQISGKKYDYSLYPIKIIPSNLSECSTAVPFNIIDNKKLGLQKLVNHYVNSDLMINCTKPEVQKKFGIMAPRILVRADGSVYSCYGFAHVHNLGNIKKGPLHKIMEKIDKDIALKTVLGQGLPGLLKLAKKYNPKIGQKTISVSNGPCDICRLLKKEITSLSL